MSESVYTVQAEGTGSFGWLTLADSLAQPKSAYTVQNVDALFGIVRSCEDAHHIPNFVLSGSCRQLMLSPD